MHLGSKEEMVFWIESVQKSYLVDRQGEGGEVLFSLALQDIRPRAAQHVAVLIVYLREEDGLVTTILALLPVLTSTGRGSDIMIPMARRNDG